MAIRNILPLLAALFAAAGAAAQDAAKPTFDPARYPPEVGRALRYANEECTRQGGGEVRFAPDTVRKLDLSGDGRDDYILGFADTECAGRKAVFCGSGGCLLTILVTLPDGRVRKVFDDYVRGYEVRPDPAGPNRGPRTVSFELHGAFCGGHGTPSCFRDHRITAKPFAFRMPQ